MTTMSMVEGETWTREFVIDRNNDMGFTDVTWGIDFTLYDAADPETPLFTSSTGNGKAKWLQRGVARVVIPQNDVQGFTFATAAFRLRVVNGADTVDDPAGRAWVCMRGTFDIVSAAPGSATGMRAF